MGPYATAQEVYAAGLVFARIGALLMTMPGFGEQAVPPRIRLGAALLITLVLTPTLSRGLPVIPGDVAGVAGQVIKEVMIGLLIGTILRLFLSSLATAGEIVSIQSTLSFAQTANPMQGQGGSSLATFLGLIGLVLIMATDLHHAFLSAMVGSYRLFPIVRPLPIDDAATLAIQTVAGSFALGVQLSAPVLVFALVFNVATGLVGRVMPQFQIFFVASPLAVMFSLSIFALSLGLVGVIWTDRYRALVGAFS